MIEPFAFNMSEADFLLDSTSVDLLSGRLKSTFRRSAKCEILTLHITRERLSF